MIHLAVLFTKTFFPPPSTFLNFEVCFFFFLPYFENSQIKALIARPVSWLLIGIVPAAMFVIVIKLFKDSSIIN